MNSRFNFIKDLIKVSVLSAVIIYGIIITGRFLSSVRPLKISEVEIAESDINKTDIQEENTKKIPAPEKKKKKTVKREIVKKTPEKIPTVEVNRVDDEKVRVDEVKEENKKRIEYSFTVERLKIIQLPDDKFIRMTFRLKNMTSGIRVKGRMFMKFYRGSDVYFYPETVLKDGTPLDLEKGVFYNIKRYKRVEVIIDKGVDLKQFSDVEFFIYEDSNGTVPVYRENHKLRVESGDIFLNPY